MKVQSVSEYNINIPDEVVTHIEKVQTKELMEAMIPELKKDKWYAIRLSEYHDHLYEGDYIQKRMVMEFKPCQEQTIVYKSSEQINFTPTKSLKDKLKNCIRYMRDKSGGVYELTEERRTY